MSVKPFSLLAQVYDAIMSDIDYEAWGEFMFQTLEARGWKPGPVLDIGCGTGNSSYAMIAKGLEVVGLDASEEMLEVARAKLPMLQFVQADFRKFNLSKNFALVYSVFDSLNNLLTDDDFLQAAKCIHRHLQPEGFLMFDVNTTIGLKELWEAGRAEGWVDNVYYRWEHSFDEVTGLAKVEAYCENDQTSFTEVHYERPYDKPLLERLLSQVGFRNIEIISYPDGLPVQEDEERIWVVCSK
jgi:ubiquinone/menaquinone biosynthesis C-methylase UbiE